MIGAPRIRHMRAEDAPAAALLLAQSWRETYEPLIGGEKVDAEVARFTAARIAADMDRAHSESFVADADGEVVGYAYACVVKGALWLDRLHIASEWQGAGVGAGLVQAVLVNYVGEPSVSVEVIKANAPAVRFYERRGFVTTEERGACGGIAGVPSLVMRKGISRA